MEPVGTVQEHRAGGPATMTLETSREVSLVSSGFGMPLLVLGVTLAFRSTSASFVSVSSGRNHVFCSSNGDGTS